MLTRITAHIISRICYSIDSICRFNLYRNTIVSERDYVSHFASHLLYPFGPFIKYTFCYIQTSDHSLETKYGVDSIIIFRRKRKVKIGLFEAKWPRYFIRKNHRWDDHNSSTESRFSKQIEKQHKLINTGIVIWEMFLNESRPRTHHSFFDTNGSSCIMHDDAYCYMLHNKIPTSTLWTNSDLPQLHNNSLNIRKLILQILRCKTGNAFPLVKNEPIRIENNNVSIFIPIPDNMQEDNNNINEFLIENGLSYYIYCDFDKLERELEK